jgi:putative CocE/NonD family hydrolase
MSYPVKIERSVWVPMEDGTRVALTLYLPDASGDGPFPAVLESLPYRKDDDCFDRDYQTYTYLAERGIAGVRIDIRGTGASTGVIADEYVGQEQADNLAIMEWLESQDWCDGNLGMWGISWGGFSALQAAMLRPPHLKAIVAMHATHDRFACDVHYTGGSLHAAEQLDWPGSMVTTNALPPDPEIFGEGWLDEWIHRLEKTPQWPFEWLRHQKRDDYWLHGSPCADYGSIECPTLLVGGWLDGYVDGMAALAENLTCPTRTIIGPWGHYRPATGVPAPTLDHFDLLARWFGHHLRGDDNGVMEDLPPVAVYVRTEPPYDGDTVSGFWRSEESWPPADTMEVDQALSDLDGGPTTWSGPQWVGSHAPFWDRAGFGSEDPGTDDGVSMCFETGPLPESLEILGTPVLEAVGTTDQDVGTLAARLLAVDPDGNAHLICRASRNLAFPDDLSDPVTPTPGKPFTVRIPLWATSAAIPAGWRLRLALAGADFPIVWPPGKAFRLTIDPHRSLLRLPVVPARGDDRKLDFPAAADLPSSPAETTRSASEWGVEHTEGTTVYRMERAGTEIQPTLTYETDQWWTVSVEDDDPASTIAHTVSHAALRRPGWDVRTEGSIHIEGGEAFVVTIELVAHLNGEEIFRRTWGESIPREWA